MLQLINVTKQYAKAKQPAIENISLTIQPGEFVGVLGRSGAGKSTLIRCINQLVRPTSGQIIWNDKNITTVPKRELLKVRCDMGMIFQNFNLIERLDVLTNVIVGRFCTIPLWRGIFGTFPQKDIDTAMEALGRVGLSHLAHRRVEELSGGQQQRVAIARVLMQKPKLILGDEPVASLDPITSVQIMNFLKEIHDLEKTTTIVNLHDVELAKKYSTRIIGIARGSVVFDGPPNQLTEEALHQIYIPDDSVIIGV
jgi:phosphonate transport system ATP-binding protein